MGLDGGRFRVEMGLEPWDGLPGAGALWLSPLRRMLALIPWS